MKTSHPPSKGFQGPNPITATRTWGVVGRAAMQQTSAVCYFIFFYYYIFIFFTRTREPMAEQPTSSPGAGGSPYSQELTFCS